jgi:hypothetical protein
MHSKLTDQGTCVFTKIVENLHDTTILEHLFQPKREWIEFCEIKDEAAFWAQANLIRKNFSISELKVSYLNQLERFPSLDAFTIYSYNWLFSDNIWYLFGEFSYLKNICALKGKIMSIS